VCKFGQHTKVTLSGYNCQYYVIFCPKYRQRVLNPPLDACLKELILEKQDAYGETVMEMEVMPDHVHLLLDVNPQIGIAKIVGHIKGYTAHMLRTEFPSPCVIVRGPVQCAVPPITGIRMRPTISIRRGRPPVSEVAVGPIYGLPPPEFRIPRGLPVGVRQNTTMARPSISPRARAVHASLIWSSV